MMHDFNAHTFSAICLMFSFAVCFE